METDLRTKRRSRVVRHSVTATAFRPEPAGFQRASFGFLSDDDIAIMKDRAEDVLADYGLVILHPDAQLRLLAAGAVAGAGANRLRLPRALIREALAATPKTARLAGKLPQL